MEWKDWNRAEQEALKQRQKNDLEAVNCTCGSTWFEQVKFYKLKSDHIVIQGQEVPTVEPGLPAYILLRCVRCTNLLQPRMQSTGFGQDIATKSYNDFLDTVECNDINGKEFVSTEDKLAKLEVDIMLLQRELKAKK